MKHRARMDVQISSEQLRDIVDRFVATFVITAKRERATLLLLTRPHERIGMLQGLPNWLMPGVGSELRGNLASLATSVGDKPGIVFDHQSVRATTLGTSGESNQWGALFISDDGRLALIFAEVGEPLLCTTTRL
jgi:hypothetical protein